MDHIEHARSLGAAATADTDDDTVHRGSGDFLRDQGIADPDEFRVKAHLCHEIATTIEGRRMTQEQVARLVGLAQSDVSRIVNSRCKDYSVWKLLKVLSALGADVLIAIKPGSGDEAGAILSYTEEAEAPDEQLSCTISP
jgi:predicted XRE-type DNA-binding protein